MSISRLVFCVGTAVLVNNLYLSTYILPRWGTYPIAEVKTVAVEDWLSSLELANGTKAKIRNIMSALFTHAMRYEWTDRNPITLVRQSAKRERIPEILEVGELTALLAELEPPYSQMVLLAAVTGLRASELLALQWSDVDFEGRQINLSRGIVEGVVGEMKTEASRKPIPMESVLAESLASLKQQSPYNHPNDWVFASPRVKGERPYWPDSALSKVVRRAAARAAITKHIGWHTFRHTYATLLTANGEDIKTVQESLRHASSRITLDVYAQGISSTKRQAQTKVVMMIQPAEKQAANG